MRTPMMTTTMSASNTLSLNLEIRLDSALLSISDIFSYSGNYEIEVKVTDSTGASRNSSLTVYVHEDLTGEFTTSSPNKIGVNSLYETHISVSGGVFNTVYHYKWGYFKDGSTYKNYVSSHNCTNW